MASIKLTGDTSGEITIAAPAVAGTNTLTLPANTGTVITSNSPASDLPSTIAGPAFSAYATTGTSATGNVFTKITLNAENFDTNSNFDTSLSRFTPTVAGYYQISAAVGVTSGSVQNIWSVIYKNGSAWQFGTLYTSASGVGGVNNMSSLVYCNGTTDYIELWGITSVTQTLDTGSTKVYMNGVLVRAA